MKIKLTEKEHILIFRKWEHTKSQKNNPMFVFTHTPESGRPETADYVTYESAIGTAKLLIALRMFERKVQGQQSATGVKV
jgi:hypothetical protein